MIEAVIPHAFALVVSLSAPVEAGCPQGADHKPADHRPAGHKPAEQQPAERQQDQPAGRDLFADTWVATDALGRTMPTAADVGLPKGDHRRVVGIFYIAWHRDDRAGLKKPYTADVGKILAADPKARLDAKHASWTEGSYHWGEPELGYFLSKDEAVIRKDMSMLADAGVDVLVMDVTNAVRYWDEWSVIFPTMQRMKAEGNRVPRFCFWAFNGPVITVVQDLYERIYKAGKYRDLWFHWDGKPLLLYNGTPQVDANPGGVQHPNLHFDAAAAADPKHAHHGDPYYTEPLLPGLHRRGEAVLHAAHDVVGLPPVGGQALRRHRGQLELRL